MVKQMNVENFMKQISQMDSEDIKEAPDLLPFFEFIQTTKNTALTFQDLVGEGEKKINNLKQKIKEGKDNPWLNEITSWNAAMELIDVQETAQRLTNRERDAALVALVKTYQYMLKVIAKEKGVDNSPRNEVERAIKEQDVMDRADKFLKEDLKDIE